MFIDIIENRSIPMLNLSMGEHVFYIKRELYDADLHTVLPTFSDVTKQFLLDAHRCIISVDGDRVSKIKPSAMPPHLLKYATQSVMGLPVEILANAYEGCVVAECSPSRGMQIEIWNGMLLYVDKMLRVVSEHDDDGNDLYVNVSVVVDLTDNVQLTFRQSVDA